MTPGSPAAAAVKIALLAVGAVAAFGLLGAVLGWFGEAADVAREELGPRALLEKYEWFKDASANLDAKAATIGVYERRMRDLEASYGDEPRRNWTREDREQHNLWRSEVAGLKAGFNLLAADYNAAHSKINWAFADAGALPRGAERPLPREYKPYITE